MSNMEVQVIKKTKEEFINLHKSYDKNTINEWLNHWSNYGYGDIGGKRVIQCCIYDESLIDIVSSGYEGRCEILWIYLIS